MMLRILQKLLINDSGMKKITDKGYKNKNDLNGNDFPWKVVGLFIVIFKNSEYILNSVQNDPKSIEQQHFEINWRFYKNRFL